MTIAAAGARRRQIDAVIAAGGRMSDSRRRLEAENAVLMERLTRLRVAFERLIADDAAARRELTRLRKENRRLQQQLERREGDHADEACASGRASGVRPPIGGRRGPVQG
jgi:chromosome segregation ATPase